MQKIIAGFSSVILIAALLWSCEQKTESKASSEATVSNDSLIKRGAYLVSIVGCDDCHSPKAMGPQGPEIIQELRLSGFPSTSKLPPVSDEALKSGWALMYPDITAAVGPWGTSYAANITSDETGLGNWTEAQFMKAMKEGKWKGMDGNRMLLPPMPWPNFARMDEMDLKAIFAFLKSTKPVKNVVPNSLPAGPPPAK